jgi:hypothetical protein
MCVLACVHVLVIVSITSHNHTYYYTLTTLNPPPYSTDNFARVIGMDPTSLFVVPGPSASVGGEREREEGALLASGDVMLSKGQHRLVSVPAAQLFSP